MKKKIHLAKREIVSTHTKCIVSFFCPFIRMKYIRQQFNFFDALIFNYNRNLNVMESVLNFIVTTLRNL